MTSMWPYVCLCLLSVFIASVSQVMLKIEAIKPHSTWWREYLNPLVVLAYTLFFGTTLLNIVIYKGLPLNLGPVLEATGYIYITLFGVTIFKEKVSAGKIVGLAVIITGIFIFAFG